MDKIFNIDEKPWICKKVVNAEKLVDNNLKLLNDNQFSLNSTIPATYCELESCLNRFVKSTQKAVKPHFLFNLSDERNLTVKQGCDLELYKRQLEHAQKLISDRDYKVKYLLTLKTTRQEILMRLLASSSRNIEPSNRPDSKPSTSINSNVDCSNLSARLVVQIWPQPEKNIHMRLEREIVFDLNQELTEFRRQFKCQRDYGVPMDLSENPENSDFVFKSELFKSGFLFIEQSFYNDMRDQNNVNLSDCIIEWASQTYSSLDNEGNMRRHNRGLGKLNQVKMENCKFKDINFRLGYPYLYQHQGHCEHLFTISDIQYFHDDDKNYPYITATSVNRRSDNLKCFMCKTRPPHWYTRHNSRLPVDPYFFCESCFYAFNYDKDKKKIGQFEAYLYTINLAMYESLKK